MSFEEASKKSLEAPQNESSSGAASGTSRISPIASPVTSNVSPLATEVADAPKTRKPRGFAAMDRRLVSLIASKGGKAAHKAGTAHEFTSDEARIAGAKGGTHPQAKRRQESAPASSEVAPADSTTAPENDHAPSEGEGETKH